MNDPGAQGTPTSTDTSATIKVQAKFVDVTGGAKYAGVAAGRRKLLSSAAAADADAASADDAGPTTKQQQHRHRRSLLQGTIPDDVKGGVSSADDITGFKMPLARIALCKKAGLSTMHTPNTR